MNEQAKTNILKGIDRKLKIRNIKVATISIIICILIILIIFLLLFVKQTPIDSSEFQNTSIAVNKQTINEISSEELPYNSLVFTSNRSISLNHMCFYIENNNSNNTSTLYFYISESFVEKQESFKAEEKYAKMSKVEPTGVIDYRILLYPEKCKTDKINEITKVCYLVYNYDNLDKTNFNTIKHTAETLWEK